MRAAWVVINCDKMTLIRVAGVGSFDFDNMTVIRVGGVVLILIPNMSRCDFNLR